VPPRRLLAALAAAALLALPAASPASPAEEFERAKNAYTFGDYALAVQLLDALLNPSVRLQDTGRIEEALELLGIAAYYEGDRTRSREAFLRLLSLRPDHRLDPLLVRPEVVELFTGIRTELKDKLEELRRKRDLRQAWEAEQHRKGQPVDVVVRREVETPLWLSCVPFGVPQFSRGSPGWGAFFAGSQALAGLGSLVAWTWALRLPGDDGRVTPDEHRFHEDRLSWVYLVAGATFYALVAWGVADGLIRHPDEPRLVEERHEVREPGAAEEGP